MKKFETRSEAIAAAARIYGDTDWDIAEEDGTFTVSPPTLTVCHRPLHYSVGDKGRIQNLFGMRSYVVVEFAGELYFQSRTR